MRRRDINWIKPVTTQWPLMLAYVVMIGWTSVTKNPIPRWLLIFLHAYLVASVVTERVAWQAEHIDVMPQTEADDSLNVIFVIGESYIREHSPLYGYPLLTTPFLMAEQQAGRLFAFSDVVSPYNQTTRVIRNLLCCNSLGDGEDWSSSPPLTAVFKKNGFRVSMLDNQKTFDLGRHVFAFSLSTFLYHPRMLEACYQEVSDSTFEYDGQMVDYHQRHRPQQQPARQLIVFHLLGQHVAFRYRYPADDEYFTADSIRFRKEAWLTDEMKTEIAHYDNATRYNDEVIRQLVGLYQHQNTVMVYVSDHGEEVYDYRGSYGRDDWSMGSSPRQVLRYQYMVPLMVWCSDAYLKRHPQVAVQLRESLDKPLMLDNTCHLLPQFGIRKFPKKLVI